MPFYTERRLFFKKSHGAARKWGQIFLLCGVSFLCGQSAAQYGFGNGWMLAKSASPSPELESPRPRIVTRDAQTISPRVTNIAPLTEKPIPAVSTDLSVVAAKQEVLTDRDVPVPVPVVGHVPPDYSAAPTKARILGEREEIPKVHKASVVAKAAPVERAEPSSRVKVLNTNEPPERTLTRVPTVDQGSRKARAKSKPAKSIKVSRRHQKPRVRTKRSPTTGSSSAYQTLPKWAGRALFDTNQ